eukprot:SAG31_NODE_5113_length_2733_cov_16.639831_3_plen_84_part_00
MGCFSQLKKSGQLNRKVEIFKESISTIDQKELPDQGGTLVMRKRVEHGSAGPLRETEWRKCMLSLDGGRYKTEVEETTTPGIL